MTWVKIDDQFPDHPKIAAAGAEAGWLYVCGLCYCACYLTDGYIPKAQVKRLADLPNPLKTAAVLQSAGLWDWDEARQGYVVHDYLEYNPNADKIKAERAAAKQRMDKARGTVRSPESQENKQDCSENVRANNNGTFSEVRSTPSPSPSPFVLSEQKEETPSASRNGGRKQKTRMSEDWQPTPEAIAKATETYPSLDISEETEKFRNYWLEKDEPRADWLAGWRNWLINAKKFAAESVPVSETATEEAPRKMSRQDEIARENGMNVTGLTNQTDPRQRDRDTIRMVERKAEEWGVSYEEAAQRVYEQAKRDFPKMNVLPVPPQPIERQRMAA